MTDDSPDGHVHRHVFRDHCAQQCFIFNRENLCPSCRHDSSGILFQNIADTLQLEVVNGIAQWSKAAAIALSFADADQEIVCAAAGAFSHLALALYDKICVSDATGPIFCRLLFEMCVAAVSSAAKNDYAKTVAAISWAIHKIAMHEFCRRALVAVDACKAVADTLRSACIAVPGDMRSAEKDDAKSAISSALSRLKKADVLSQKKNKNFSKLVPFRLLQMP